MKFIQFGIALLLTLPIFLKSSVNAVSDSVVIAQIQTESASSAVSEVVILQNISPEPVDVTNWCIKYYSAADNLGFESCLLPPDIQTKLIIPSAGLISFATQGFIDSQTDFQPDVVMSGGMSSDGGHLRLQDSDDVTIDKVGWGPAQNPELFAAIPHETGESLSRSETEGLFIDTDSNIADFSSKELLSVITASLYEEKITVDLCINIEGLQEVLPEGMLSDDQNNCYTDVCPLLEGLQIELPQDYEINAENECVLSPLESATLLITELYPNAPSVDDGQEFIELYNPNDRDINLAGYELQIGPGFTKVFRFTQGEFLANEYQTFTDLETGIVLPNSTGQKLRLINPTGQLVSESELYSNAQEDESWALVEDQWIWTNQITPEASNKPYLEPAVDEVEGVTSVLAPCPVGKFRNPETNRCKNIESAVSQLVPCAAHQERNPETNRCRNITSSSSTLTPCKPGQKRNPATNRCRSISGSTSELVPCDDDEERNPETNRCRKISAVLTSADLSEASDITPLQAEGNLNWPLIAGTMLFTGGYMLFEWRRELRQRWRLWQNR